MELKRLSSKEEQLFNQAFKLYESAFPVEERRDNLEQVRVMGKAEYHFDLILKDGVFIGIMLYWETKDFVFLEHFATMPIVRGKGFGAKALDLLKKKNKIILLEIEPPIDEMTERRYGFYKRNGFIMNPYYHIQAKYHLGDEDLELKILSFPRALEKEEYRSFYEYMTREIGIQPNKSKDIVIREFRDGDDINQVAKLIYLTDPYIYPYWFDNIEDGISVIREMINLPTLYNKENITVAVTSEGFIAGAMVSKRLPFTEKEDDIRSAFSLSGVKCDSRTHEIFEAYYEKMGEDDGGFYIANVTVDSNYRKRGIAGALVDYLLKKDEDCVLECVVANISSVRLYQRLGFKIAYEYPGVKDVPCYKMVYKG